MGRYLLFFVLLTPVWALSQTRVITGRVKDESGKPLAGASVMVIPSGKGTVTKGNGEFVITVGEKDKSLVVSLVNFETDTTALGAGTEYEIRIKSASAGSLMKLAVVGWWEQPAVGDGRGRSVIAAWMDGRRRL
jgi:hypothetical protein